MDELGLARKVNSGGKGEYGDVGGHHVHAKAGFKNHACYDPCKGFSLGQNYMKKRGWDHDEMTRTQRKLFDDLAKSGRPNTLKAHSEIAKKVLIAGGAKSKEAEALLKESLDNLKGQNVTCPSHIPWN